MEREEAERLVARYGPSVYRLAYARTGSKEDAEDVMQETFLRLVRAAPEQSILEAFECFKSKQKQK